MLVRDSRSPIVDRVFGHVGKRGLAWSRTAFGIALISYESRPASDDGPPRCCSNGASAEIGMRLESTWPPLAMLPAGLVMWIVKSGTDAFSGEGGGSGSDIAT